MVVVGLLALLLVVSGVTRAAQGGKNKDKKKAAPDETLAFILEHTDELKVTSDQLPKLELLQTTENRVMNDPAVKAIMQKINAANAKARTRNSSRRRIDWPKKSRNARTANSVRSSWRWI